MTFPIIPPGCISQATMSPKGQVRTTPTHLNLHLCVQFSKLSDSATPEPRRPCELFPLPRGNPLTASRGTTQPQTCPLYRKAVSRDRWYHLFPRWLPTAQAVQPVLSFTGPIRKANPALDPSAADSQVGCPLHLGLRGQLSGPRRAPA